MPDRETIVARLLDPGIVAIIRAPASGVVLPAARALLAGGVTAIEVTLTTPGANAAIREVRAELGDRALTGVGTVLDPDAARAAIEAGAQFVVTPVCQPALVTVAHERGCPIMLGCYTPTEAQSAHVAGADFIKLFPADTLGPKFIKAVRAPLPHLRIVPTGGVDLDTLESFVQAGCPAVGVGSCLVSKEILAKADWDTLKRRAAAFVAAMKSART
ncbi:MAG: bifunctional 4-hydroxy-2-oxoglutarate aldolase/2-dehydro-3-deoxy-phosphogluconate aldolase [Verrucomicrobiales bacterium]|nr:bifunctional 4-hydroxy-2-oxoglutarate aldolase/2-dehydro-3-deoxy-phosphogluconate aldolase [Verrucomicrobiales bacterium]